jgi:hypothetical protein
MRVYQHSHSLYVCTYAFMCKYHIHTDYMYARMYLCVYINIHTAYMYARMYSYVYINIYTSYMYARMYLCVYITIRTAVLTCNEQAACSHILYT